VFRPTSTLDHIAIHEQLRLAGLGCSRCRARARGRACGGICTRCMRGPAGCGCARCRQRASRFEAIGFEAPQRRRRVSTPRPAIATRTTPAPRQTPAQRGGPFAAWRGWGSAVTLQQLIDERRRLTRLHRTRAGRNAQPVPELRDFFRPGQNLYRITLPTADNPRYLSIGQTANSIAARTIHHYTPGGRRSRGEKSLRRLMRAAGADQILVQAGRLPPNMPDRRAHGYEIWLQDRERVSDWPLIDSSRTFESAWLAANDAFAELEAAG
jgi:hypothetical protein